MKKFILLLISTSFLGTATTMFGEIYNRTLPGRSFNPSDPSWAAGSPFLGTLLFADRFDPNLNPQSTLSLVKTYSDGQGFYLGSLALQDKTIYVMNRINGYVGIDVNYGVVADETDYYTKKTTFDATAGGTINGDDPNVSAVSGDNHVDERLALKTNWRSGAYVNNQNPNNRSVGSVTFIEGNYYGSSGTVLVDGSSTAAPGGFLNCIRNLDIQGASFIGGNDAQGISGTYLSYAGNQENAKNLFAANPLNTVNVNKTASMEGLYSTVNGIEISQVSWNQNIGGTSTVTISNKTSYMSERRSYFKDNQLYHDAIIGGNGGSISSAGVGNQTRNVNSGNGLFIHYTAIDASLGSVDLTIKGGDFIGGGDGNSSIFVTDSSAISSSNVFATALGGSGLSKRAGANTIGNANFVGGRGGSAEVHATYAVAQVDGGNGIWLRAGAATSITNSVLRGGRAGSASMNGDLADAYAIGGHGLKLSYNTSATVANLTAIGADGGRSSASGSNTTAKANGGSGIFSDGGTLTVNGGSYTGGSGGTAVADIAEADGGSGVRIESGTLNINGGSFSGAMAGTVFGDNAIARDGRGVFAVNSTVTINEVGTGVETIIDGIYFTNSTAKTLTLTKGTVNGDVDFEVAAGQTATLNITTNATINGTVRQKGGTVKVVRTQAAASKQFKDVEVDGIMNFSSASAFVSANDARFSLANNSQLTFANALTLSTNASIDVGYGTVRTTGNLIMDNNSSMTISYNGLSPANFGTVTNTGGSLLMSDPTARIYVNGTAATSSGSFKPITATGTTLATNVNTMVEADLGWLVTPTAVESAGIRIDWTYNSLSNSSLADLDLGLIDLLDDTISSNGYANFFALNSMGQDAGSHLIRYSESQLPDMVDSAFQIQQQVAEQIAARGTEYRSMNGYASTKPRFGKQTSPAGAAGPAANGNQSMQGWVRAYGSFAQRDTQGNFDAYDNTTWGSVVGVDQSFGKLLVGLAGGYANSDLDAASTYQGKVDTYHGSIYSTYGGESTFVDLALTYGRSTSKEDSVVSKAEFDSDIYSGYLGLGKTFNATDTLAITPEVSGLVSYYNQEAFTRTGIVPKNIPEYDAWSYLGTLGGNIATIHQIDWMNRGLAFIPEIRAHWLHEFNAELDNASYTVPTLPGSSFPLYMRPREEDLFRIGLGIDVWSWRYQRSKFEFDYDGLFANGYAQHIVSGKVTVRF